MNRERLRYIGDEYEITAPIDVEVTASRDSGGTIFYLNVVNLRNELIFGVGSSKSFAYQMLRKELRNYYEFLMSSNLDGYDLEDYILDKKKLQRSIKKRESAT
jgi:hypothetical protein